MKIASLWDDFVKTYSSPEIAARFFLGFSCGIPFLLTLTILDLWLKDCGVSNTVIGLFTLLHWPFTLKFLWAPFIDCLNFPYLSKKFGRRKGWAIASQMLLFTGMIGMSLSDPKTSMLQLMCFTSLVAFADGMQDMSLYAYQINRASKKMLGPIAGVFVFGYRVGMFFAKSISLYLAHYFGWHVAYFMMAFSIFLSTIFILTAEEPDVVRSPEEKHIKEMAQLYAENLGSRFEFLRIAKITIYECLLCPFTIFLKQKHWKNLIAIIVLFKCGDIMAHKMSKPFYVDIGFSMLEIANVVQVFGTLSTLFGGIIGGYLVKKHGIRREMFYSGVAHALSCFAFVIMSKTGHNIGLLYLTTFVENITGGAMTTAFLAFLYSLCDKKYCASQYALLWAFYDFGGIICRSVSGALADFLGWTNFFLLVPLTFVPSLIILYPMILHDENR